MVVTPAAFKAVINSGGTLYSVALALKYAQLSDKEAMSYNETEVAKGKSVTLKCKRPVQLFLHVPTCENSTVHNVNDNDKS